MATNPLSAYSLHKHNDTDNIAYNSLHLILYNSIFLCFYYYNFVRSKSVPICYKYCTVLNKSIRSLWTTCWKKQLKEPAEAGLGEVFCKAVAHIYKAVMDPLINTLCLWLKDKTFAISYLCKLICWQVTVTVNKPSSHDVSVYKIFWARFCVNL